MTSRDRDQSYRSWRRGPVPDHVHGTANGYGNYGCRCPDCREAHRRKMKNYRKRMLLWRLSQESSSDRVNGDT